MTLTTCRARAAARYSKRAQKSAPLTVFHSRGGSPVMQSSGEPFLMEGCREIDHSDGISGAVRRPWGHGPISRQCEAAPPRSNCIPSSRAPRRDMGGLQGPNLIDSL
jgi:hypothetical protein